MRILLAMVLAFQCTRCVFAEPLTVKEISLMLRCGYSSETVLRTLSNRHFAGNLNPAAEKELTNVNASPALIDALKSGNNSASAQEMAQARQLASAQKVSVQKTIAAQEDASRQIAAQQSRNTRIVVAPAPSAPKLEMPSALDRTNAAISAGFEKEFDHRTQAEKQAAAPAANQAWCAEHPVECAQQQQASAQAEQEDRQQAQKIVDRIQTDLVMGDSREQLKTDLFMATGQGGPKTHQVTDQIQTDLSMGHSTEQLKTDLFMLHP